MYRCLYDGVTAVIVGMKGCSAWVRTLVVKEYSEEHASRP
jgi:hypothetical protein